MLNMPQVQEHIHTNTHRHRLHWLHAQAIMLCWTMMRTELLQNWVNSCLWPLSPNILSPHTHTHTHFPLPLHPCTDNWPGSSSGRHVTQGTELQVTRPRETWKAMVYLPEWLIFLNLVCVFICVHVCVQAEDEIQPPPPPACANTL